MAYWFVLALGLVAIAAKYKYNGLVFGFDYGIYQPDGKYYTYMALDFINNDSKQSAQSVVNWYATHGFKGNIFQVSDLVPGIYELKVSNGGMSKHKLFIKL